MKTKKVSFLNNKYQKLAGILHVPRETPAPAIIISHGFGGNKDNKENWENELCKNGFVVLRYDFSGGGDSEGKFIEVTTSQYAKDVYSAINFVSSLPQIDKKRIGLTGNSLGGSVSLICAKDKRIKIVSTIAPPTYPRELFKKLFNDYKEGKFDSLLKKYEKLYLKHGKVSLIRAVYSYYTDAIKYNFEEIFKEIKCPIQIIHGDKDELVPTDQSRRIIKFANKKSELKIIKGAPHRFSDSKYEENMIELNVAWSNKWMK